MVPSLQPSGHAMVGLKLWFQSDLLKVKKVYLIVTTPVRVVVHYNSDYFCCFFEGHSSFLASLDEKIFEFISFELKFAE